MHLLLGTANLFVANAKKNSKSPSKPQAKKKIQTRNISKAKELLVNEELLGIYINPDEIEKEIREYGFIEFSNYGFETNKNEEIS